MRRNFCFALLSVALFAVSCQRESDGILPGGNNPTDSTATPDTATNTAHNLIRSINIKGTSFSDPVNLTFSIQYDTPASRITFFVTDSIPNDSVAFDPSVKGVTYQYNRAGYLTGSNILYINGTQAPYFSIARNAANQIQNIIEYNTEEINGVVYNDTVFYRYGTGFIEDSVRLRNLNNTADYNRYIMNFDAQNKLLSKAYYSSNSLQFTDRYSYDAQNNIRQLASDHYTIDYTYDVQKDTGWKALPQLFLGRDAYVLMHSAYSPLGYNLLSFIIEENFETIYNPLLTQPLASFHAAGESVFDANDSQTVTFSTTYTPENKIKTITATPSNGNALTYTFSY